MAAVVAISSCQAQARHPRLAVLMAVEGVAGGSAVAMTSNSRCLHGIFAVRSWWHARLES